MQERPAKIVIQHVEKRYGRVQALQPTSLQVATGEFLTLLGPSGSGKTTLLSLLAGLTPCDGGSITLDGQDITHAPPQLRGMGMVFQNYALFPHLSVAQNLAFGLDVRGVPEARMRERVREVLSLVRMSDYAQRMPGELSGGQQQRVALARAFAYEPQVVLMDEPLGALDRYLREEMKLEIARLHRELGTTVIYVTHDQEEALVLSDRICLMNQARVEQVGSAQDLYFNPRSRFAAEFLGESNLLEATLNADRTHAWVQALGQQLPVHSVSHPGTHGHLLLRPQALQFEIAPESSEWRVHGVQFIGAWLRYTLRHRNGVELTATRACTRLHTQDSAHLSPGTPVALHWPPMSFIGTGTTA